MGLIEFQMFLLCWVQPILPLALHWLCTYCEEVVALLAWELIVYTRKDLSLCCTLSFFVAWESLEHGRVLCAPTLILPLQVGIGKFSNFCKHFCFWHCYLSLEERLKLTGFFWMCLLYGPSAISNPEDKCLASSKMAPSLPPPLPDCINGLWGCQVHRLVMSMCFVYVAVWCRCDLGAGSVMCGSDLGVSLVAVRLKVYIFIFIFLIVFFFLWIELSFNRYVLEK